MSKVVGRIHELGTDQYKTAMQGLIRTGAGAVGPLIEALRDLDKRVTFDAAMTLRAIGEAAEIPLIVALRKDRDDEARCWAAYLLGHIGSDYCVRPLCYALEDPSAEVQVFAAQALERKPSMLDIRPRLEAITRD